MRQPAETIAASLHPTRSYPLRARLVRHVVMSIGWRVALALSILICGHTRKCFYEGDDVPHFLIGMCCTERRHARHLNSMLDDPKQLARCPLFNRIREVRCLWI